MILNRVPVTLAEVKAHTKDTENKPMEDYLKAFTKLSKSDVLKLVEEIRKLDNPKIKEENIIKIGDFLPKDLEDLNKIFLDVTLNEEESSALLEIVKRY